MRALTVLAFSFLLATPASHSAEPDEKDNHIVIGQRVGAITHGATLLSLRTLYGAKNVKAAELPGPEGTTLEGIRMFEGTDRELELIYDQEGEEKIVTDVVVIGSAWKFECGLRVGMSLEEVEKINGGPFQVMGFDWDYGGFANFEGGKLERGVSVRFYPTAERVSEKLSGDVQIKSTDADLKAAKPVVQERIMVMLEKQ
jgi:hypothetical protein